MKNLLRVKKTYKTAGNRFVYSIIILFLGYVSIIAQEDTKGIKLGNIADMSGNWFIAYHNGIEQIHADQDTPEQSVVQNEFLLKRSYFTLKKDLNDKFSVRYTMDLALDSEGADAGNVETRLKYLYLETRPNLQTNWLKDVSISIGIVKTPWLDFEQKINTYRVQDNMFIERNKIFNSADFGFTVEGNVGSAMPNDTPKHLTQAMKGKYMTFAFGLYNGAGYSGKEKNTNKVFSTRLSFRPFAQNLPQLQCSTYFNIGKGNNENNPDFKQFLGFVAFTGKQLTLTAQHHWGKGDFRALYIAPDNAALSLQNQGFSTFAEYKLGGSPWAVWGRYDKFNVKILDKHDTKRYIGGITYKVNDYLRIVANAERNETEKENNNIYELNFEIKF